MRSSLALALAILACGRVASAQTPAPADDRGYVEVVAQSAFGNSLVKTASYVIDPADTEIFVNGTGVVLTLPDVAAWAALHTNGQALWMKDISGAAGTNIATSSATALAELLDSVSRHPRSQASGTVAEASRTDQSGPVVSVPKATASIRGTRPPRTRLRPRNHRVNHSCAGVNHPPSGQDG